MSHIRASFERAAAHYDAHASVQREIADRLLERLDLIRITPACALDLGCGTGQGAVALAARFPTARIVAADCAQAMLTQTRTRIAQAQLVACDARRLPFAAHALDLIFSASTVQWCEPLADVFAAVHRSLRTDGVFLFSTYGPDTLRELRAAQHAAGITDGVNVFHDMHPIGDLLRTQGFRDPVLDAEHLHVRYESPQALLRALRGIGSTRMSKRTIVSPAQWQQMCAAYPRSDDGAITATYEVIYGYARGAEPGVSPVDISGLGTAQSVE